MEIVLGQSAMLQTTATQLESIQGLSIPSLSTSQTLIEHLPELRELAVAKQQQDLEIEELTARSIKLVDEWYRLYVRPANEGMVQVDRELREVTKYVRRLENESEG